MNHHTQPDLLEIVFAQRNRAYGAYLLRREYPANLGKALGWSFLLIAAFLFLPQFLKAVAGKISSDSPDHFVVALTAPPPTAKAPPPVPPKLQTPPAETRAKQAFTPITVVEDDKAPDTQPTIIDSLLANPADIGLSNSKGITGGPPVLDDPFNTGTGLPGDGIKPQIKDTIRSLIDVQKPPGFPGGEAELLRYLAEHIRYPEMARASGIHGTVAIGFVVDKTGRITDASILKDIGGGCGKEALRVIEKMPAWTPGEANGNSVRVRFTLPVRFELN